MSHEMRNKERDKILIDDHKCSRCGGSGKTKTMPLEMTLSRDAYTTIELFNETCQDCSGVGTFKHIYIFDIGEMTLDGVLLSQYSYDSYNIRSKSIISFDLVDDCKLSLAGGQVRVINVPNEIK